MMKYYAIKGREIVLTQEGEDLSREDLSQIERLCGATDHFTEESNGIEAIGIKDPDALPSAYKCIPLRSYFYNHAEQEVFQASRAKALLEWRAGNHYCSKCGTGLVEHETMTARVCPECGNLIFPRIDPCIIVVVHREGKILLARHVQRNQDIYACIAGFVEAGENIENAVEREILEETGLKVRNVRYFGSQSWPFPSQLMFGFTADYESGEIKLQEDEIADAQWFDPNDCPASPQPGSIAYQLIQSFRK